MYTLNIVSVLKKMTIRELREFIYENYCKRVGFSKKGPYYSLKKQKKKLYYHLQSN